MLDRRQLLLGGATLAAGVRSQAAHAVGEKPSSWSPIVNGKTTTVNGIDYEAECGPNQLALQKSAQGVYRFSMIPGNGWPDEGPKDEQERTELDGWRSQIEVKKQSVLWASWSMFYEPDPWSTSDWCILRQIYAKYDDGGTPWSVLVLKPEGELHWVGGAADDPADFWPSRHTEPIAKGDWLNFVETYKFDPEGGKGYWQSWLNGKQVLDFQGAVGDKDAKSYYAKFGIYRGRGQSSGGPVEETVKVRYVNMRFTTQDLSKLIEHPDPLPSWERSPA